MVWISTLVGSVAHSVLSSPVNEQGERLAMPKAKSPELIQRIKQQSDILYGSEIDPDGLAGFRIHRMNTKRKVPDAFTITDAYPILSERAREIFEAHDLGRTKFYEIEMRYMNNSRVEGRFFIIHILEAKNTLIPEKSDVEPFNHIRLGESYLKSPFSPHPICLQHEAEQGVELWRESKLDYGIYLSARLAKACKAAKLRGLNLKKVALE